MGDSEARALLGVSEDASQEEVRSAFGRRAVPLDAVGAKRQLRRVVAAYRTLAPALATEPGAPGAVGWRRATAASAVALMFLTGGVLVGLGVVAEVRHAASRPPAAAGSPDAVPSDGRPGRAPTGVAAVPAAASPGLIPAGADPTARSDSTNPRPAASPAPATPTPSAVPTPAPSGSPPPRRGHPSPSPRGSATP